MRDFKSNLILFEPIIYWRNEDLHVYYIFIYTLIYALLYINFYMNCNETTMHTNSHG